MHLRARASLSRSPVRCADNLPKDGALRLTICAAHLFYGAGLDLSRKASSNGPAKQPKARAPPKAKAPPKLSVRDRLKKKLKMGGRR